MTACPETADGAHAFWSVYRFGWPWGLPFPKVRRCLYCGAKR